MKQYKKGIYVGMISILCSLLFVGIPIQWNFVGILPIIVLTICSISVIYAAFFEKDSLNLLRMSIVYAVAVLVVSLLVQFVCSNYFTCAIGFIPGLIISTSGLRLTILKKDKCKITLSIILNILGLVISLASAAMIICNGSIII